MQQPMWSTDFAQAFEPAGRPVHARDLDAVMFVRFERAFAEALSTLLAPVADSPVAEQVWWHFGLGCESASRGKRVRPRLLFAVAFDEGGSFETALDAALAIEFLHNYSLVHDDIEDADELRRGRQTVWSRYGVPHGVNAGDAICAVTYLTLLRNSGGSPLERVTATARVLQRANFAMCAGQGYDLGFESASAVTLEAYLAMIDGKTATLFGAACELGALCAGCDPLRAGAYAELGRAYGHAFQIRNDGLGLASDIARRKWSFPIVWALAGPPSEARTAIATRYARVGRIGPADVRVIIEALESLGARRAADAACEDRLRLAARLAQRHRLDSNGVVAGLFTAGAEAKVSA